MRKIGENPAVSFLFSPFSFGPAGSGESSPTNQRPGILIACVINPRALSVLAAYRREAASYERCLVVRAIEY